MIDVSPFTLTEESSPVIARFAKKNNDQAIAEAIAKHRGGFNIRMSLFFDAEGFPASISFSQHSTYDTILRSLRKLAGKHHSTTMYTTDFVSQKILIAPLPFKGGCNNGKTKVEKIIRSKFETLKLTNVKSKNNNCLLQCFNVHTQRKGNSIKADAIRKIIGFPLSTKIDIDDVPQVSDYFQQSYILFNQNYELLSQMYYEGSNDYLILVLRDEHYYIAEVINHLNCPECGKWMNAKNQHNCNPTRMSYNQRMIKKNGGNFVLIKNIKDTKINYNSVIHFDLETFQEKHVHVPYACGWYNRKYKLKYGKDCINTFVDEIVQEKNKFITAYNGSGFDFYFLIDILTSRGVDVTDIILSNGKVMSFKFGQNNKVFDLYLFVMTSLDKACNDFKIENAKSSFNHKLIKNWNDVERHKEKVLPYLRLDVLALKELFESFNDMMFRLKKVNITSFITASHMAYDIWASMLRHKVEIPNDLEKCNFISKSTYDDVILNRKSLYQKIILRLLIRK